MDKIIFVCSHNLNYCLKIKLIKKEQAVLIYNGITEPKFLEKFFAKKYLENIIKRSLEQYLIIGTVSRLEYQKDIENLVKTAKISGQENYIWLVIGDGPERKKVEKLIRSLDLENRFFLLGNIPSASQYLKAFDIFVLPSRCEGFPLAILEAMNGMVPLVATKVGGVPEMIENGREGFLVEPENPEKLSQAIIKLLENFDLAQNLAKRAFEKAKRFSLTRMIQATLNLYQEILKK